jgi:hypothetical protein
VVSRRIGTVADGSFDQLCVVEHDVVIGRHEQVHPLDDELDHARRRRHVRIPRSRRVNVKIARDPARRIDHVIEGRAQRIALAPELDPRRDRERPLDAAAHVDIVDPVGYRDLAGSVEGHDLVRHDQQRAAPLAGLADRELGLRGVADADQRDARRDQIPLRIPDLEGQGVVPRRSPRGLSATPQNKRDRDNEPHRDILRR